MIVRLAEMANKRERERDDSAVFLIRMNGYADMARCVSLCRRLRVRARRRSSGFRNLTV